MTDQLLNQEQLAKRLNISQATVSRWLSGSKPNRHRAIFLARTLNVSVEWLLNGVGKYDPFDSYITPATHFQSSEVELDEGQPRKAIDEAKAKFPTRLRWLREHLGISLSAFARHCGYGASYISRLENSSRANPSSKFLAAITESFGISESWLRLGVGLPYAPVPSFTPPPDLAAPLKNLNIEGEAMSFAVVAKVTAKLMTTNALHQWLGQVLTHPQMSEESKKATAKVLSDLLARRIAKG